MHSECISIVWEELIQRSLLDHSSMISLWILAESIETLPAMIAEVDTNVRYSSLLPLCTVPYNVKYIEYIFHLLLDIFLYFYFIEKEEKREAIYRPEEI